MIPSCRKARGLSPLSTRRAGDCMERRETVPALTTIRLFPAIAVLVFHDGVAANSRLMGPGYFNPVDFFFIISGFILAYVYSESDLGLRVSDRRFFIARA